MSAGRYAAELGISPRFLNQLRALVIQNKRMLPGPGAGRRRSPRAGSSVELMDYRNYVHGDDLRRLDWNVYARLDALFIRVFRAEENLLVRLYVDISRSMAFGDPPKAKLAASLAGALAFAALVGQDRVEAAALGGQALQFIPTASGEVGAARVWAFLAGLKPDGTGDLHRHLREAAGRLREPGLTILISDGLFEGGLIDSLKALLAMGHEPVLIHLLDREEWEPTLEGDWRLTDSEDPQQRVEVTLTPVTAGDYRGRIRQYVDELRDFCRRHNAGYYLVSAETPVEEVLLSMMRGSLTQ